MYAEECLLDQSDRLGLSLIIFDSFEIPWSMEPPLSLFFFFLLNPGNFFPVTFFCLSHFFQSPAPWVKSRVLPSRSHATSSATTPTLPRKGKQAPQQNCNQNQNGCCGESYLHRGTSWQGLPQRSQLQKKEGTTPGQVNSAPDGCWGVVDQEAWKHPMGPTS